MFPQKCVKSASWMKRSPLCDKLRKDRNFLCRFTFLFLPRQSARIHRGNNTLLLLLLLLLVELKWQQEEMRERRILLISKMNWEILSLEFLYLFFFVVKSGFGQPQIQLVGKKNMSISIVKWKKVFLLSAFVRLQLVGFFSKKSSSLDVNLKDEI